MIVPNNYGRNMSDVCFILAEMFSSFVSLAGRVNSKSTFLKNYQVIKEFIIENEKKFRTPWVTGSALYR